MFQGVYMATNESQFQLVTFHLGDELYGGDMSVMKRHALHCKTIGFIHPVTKEKVVVDSEIPDDMASLFK